MNPRCFCAQFFFQQLSKNEQYLYNMLESYYFSGSLKNIDMYHDNSTEKKALLTLMTWENYLAYDTASQVI